MAEVLKTAPQNDMESLKKELEASKLIHEQIAMLNSERDFKKAMNEVLANIGSYLKAERAYIFQNKGDCFCKTFEWCAPGISSEMELLQNVPGSELVRWTAVLEKGECVVIPDIHNKNESHINDYLRGLLTVQNIRSAVEAPISVGDRLVGFIGVDNAPGEVARIIAQSLKVLGTFIGTVIRNHEESEKLERNHRAMKDSRDMQREITASISCGVLAYTIPEYKMLTINTEARRIIGCRDDETPLESFMRYLNDNVLPEDREQVRVRKISKPGDVQHITYRVNRDGNIMSVSASVKMLEFATGQKYILCSLLDITEQVNLSHSLAVERKSYREALENGSEFTFFFDVTDGIIHEEFTTAHGTNLIKELGFSVPVGFDELLSAYIKCGSIHFAGEGMEKYFTSEGLLTEFEKGVTNVVSEFRDSAKDLYIRTNCLMSLDSSTGHVLGTVVASDITELRKAELARNESLRAANMILKYANDEKNVRLDAILSGVAGGLKIVDIDDNYKYTYISEGAAQLQGYTVDEFLEKFGHHIVSNMFSDEDDEALAEANRQIAETGSYTVKYRVFHKDGSIRWVIDRGRLVNDSATGKRLYYILSQDVTELENRNIELSDVLSMQQSMADSLGSGILAYTLPGHRVLLLNQEARRMFSYKGASRYDFGPDIMSGILPEDVEAVREAYRKLLNIGDEVGYVFHRRTENDDIRAYKCSTKLLCFENGQKYILSSLNDITEQEHMEMLLDEERRQYRNALAMGSEAFFSIDMNEGVLDHDIVTKSGVNLTAVLGVTMPATYDCLAEAWLNEDRIFTWSKGLEIIRSREKVIEHCAKGNSIIDFEYHIPASGRYYHVMALLDNIGGKPRISFIIYDITSSRQEERLRRTVIESLGKVYSGLYHFSLHNDTYTMMKLFDDIGSKLPKTGKYSDFVREYCDSFVMPEFQDEMRDFLSPETICRNLDNDEYTTIEYQRRGIGWCRLSLISSDRDENGKVMSCVFAGTLIEAQKQAELAAQETLRSACEAANIANAAKTDFLANMSHDIRTPMNAIIGMTAIAGAHIDDRERVSDCLSKITVSSKHLLGIINEVLDMSKIESGKMDLQEEEFNLPELIDNLMTMCKPDIAARGHSFSVALKNLEHEDAIGDSQRIQQVFMNIMSNAIKYTPNGGKINLSISEKSTNKPNVACYEFVFEDNGIGMTQESVEHIFEPFSRAKNDSRVDKIQGTGLGMPITKNIVQMMNGDIKVESELDVGTRVTITFFLKLKSSDEEIDYAKFINLSVLVADDDETSCVYTCELLKEIGIAGEWVLNGREAVEKTVLRHESGNDFFAVILDWAMPEMDGVETARQIREKVGKNVPIIIISAYDWSDIEQEARAAGVNAFISKPLFKSRMVHTFNELVDGVEKSEKTSGINALAKENFAGKRALIVEDNEINAEIAEELLGMAGIEVSFAQNGRIALETLRGVEDGRFDVVFMDIQMPVMNGYEAARAIRAEQREYLKTVPIIAMTANAFAEDVAAAKDAGMNEHIAKPLDINRLLAALRKWVK